MMRNVIGQLVMAFGLVALSPLAAASCYCPQGHYSGGNCVAPLPHGNGFRMLPVAQPICSNGSSPKSDPMPRGITNQDIHNLYVDRDIDLSFDQQNGHYAVVVSTTMNGPSNWLGEFVSERFYPVYACASKEMNLPIKEIIHHKNYRIRYALDSGCKEFSGSILTERIALWRGQLADGSWNFYWTEYQPNTPAKELKRLKQENEQRCKQQSQTCQFLGDFGEQLGTF